MTSSCHELLAFALAENNIHLEAKTISLLDQYLQLLRRWNKVYNLTTITEPRDMVYLHLIDSLAITPYLHGLRLLDVGSGAGLPGLPLAIAHPQQQWCLLDKNSKKTRFMTQVIAELGLKNVEVIHARSEEFHPAQQFDTILSRAFGTIQFFAETCGHLLQAHGLLLAMKGKYPTDEINDVPNGFQLQQIIELKLKGINVERHLVLLDKTL